MDLAGLVHATGDDVWVVRAAASLLVLNVALMGVAGLPQAVLHGENLGYRRLGLSTAILFVSAVVAAIYAAGRLGPGRARGGRPRRHRPVRR